MTSDQSIADTHDPENHRADEGSQDARRHEADEAHHPHRARGEHPESAERHAAEHTDKYAGKRDEEEAARQAEFAREHDPADHDIAAGQEARQPGDWTADEAGGEQVWDADGNLVEGQDPSAPGPQAGGDGATAGNGTEQHLGAISSLDEIRDGGYGVGSAAPIEGKTPLGHPIKGWEDTKTYALPGQEAYGAATVDVWFTDPDAAERFGFTRAR